ncbi:MAG: ATP-binding protein [Myxococcota bacterium]|nr:ATP-binding protein [Myxococcota bacterium]
MEIFPALGLRTRIALALAVVLALFIVLTEVSISELLRVTLAKHADILTSGEGSSAVSSLSSDADFLHLRRLILFYMIFGAAVALVLGSWAVTRLVVRPLSQVTQAVEQVAAGSLDVEVPVRGSGEIIRLGVAFNRMTATLREQRTELNDRLAQLEKYSQDLKSVQDHLIRAAKLASVGTLAAGVAHEIGNPLAGVLGLLEAYEEEKDAANKKKYRDLMRQEIQRIDRIIRDLLVYARPVHPEDGDGGGEGTATQIEMVYRDVLSLLKAQRQFDRVAVEANFEGGPWELAISRDDLTQILINLFLNAAQAMGGQGRIQIAAEHLRGWHSGFGGVARDAVRLTITDTGPGIPKAHADRIFDPFFSERPDGEGTGLGLAVCMSICERYGGEIRLDEAYQSGSRFIITLPTPLKTDR